MVTAGARLLAGRGVDVGELVGSLDSFYCYNLVVMHWAHAVRNRLEGQAAFLLPDELGEVAGGALQAAGELADRIGDLGGEVTADPSAMVARSPLAAFQLPASFSDVEVILRYALEQLRVIVAAYGSLLERLGGRDEITHGLVTRLLAKEVHREADIVAALGKGS